MPRGKALTFESQRAAILQTAAALFAEKGFAGASMADLAAACGVSKALLYHYYRDKTHLLFDTADSYLDTLIALVAEVRARQLAPTAHFKALVTRLMQEYEHAQTQHMVLVQDVKYLGTDERARIIAKQRQVVDAVAQAIAGLRPRFRKKAMRVPLAMILFGMINWTFTWLRPDGPLSYDDMSKVVADIFLAGIASN
jgi:AcrR family transcriptional regulator